MRYLHIIYIYIIYITLICIYIHFLQYFYSKKFVTVSYFFTNKSKVLKTCISNYTFSQYKESIFATQSIA